jgi:putative addiction module component (TIGR02574 family)
MSFAEVLQELPSLTVEQRQIIIRQSLELDEPSLAAEDEAAVDARLAAHRQNPSSAIPLDEMKARLRSRFSK